VISNEVLQYVRMQVDDVDGRRATRRGAGEQCVPTKICNIYELRSVMLIADKRHVRI